MRDPIRQTAARATNLSDIKSQMGGRRMNWENMDPDYANEAGISRFGISPELMPEGVDFVWITSEVRGQPFPEIRSQFERGGWTPVHHEDFDGRFDGMWGKRGQTGEINVGGLVLAARPMEISARAKMRERRAAEEPMKLKEMQLRGGVDVPGGDHPTARNFNHINRTHEATFAAIPVPKDER